MARQLKSIECSAQPLCFSFHPFRDVVAAGLADGTVEGEFFVIVVVEMQVQSCWVDARSNISYQVEGGVTKWLMLCY